MVFSELNVGVITEIFIDNIETRNLFAHKYTNIV
jgi:hypothetical protein